MVMKETHPFALEWYKMVFENMGKNGLVLKTEPFLKTQSLGGKNCAQKLEREYFIRKRA